MAYKKRKKGQIGKTPAQERAGILNYCKNSLGIKTDNVELIARKICESKNRSVLTAKFTNQAFINEVIMGYYNETILKYPMTPKVKHKLRAKRMRREPKEQIVNGIRRASYGVTTGTEYVEFTGDISIVPWSDYFSNDYNEILDEALLVETKKYN